MRIYKIIVGRLNKLADRVIGVAGDTAGTLGHVAGFIAGSLVAGFRAGYRDSCPSEAQKSEDFWKGVHGAKAKKAAAYQAEKIAAGQAAKADEPGPWVQYGVGRFGHRLLTRQPRAAKQDA